MKKTNPSIDRFLAFHRLRNFILPLFSLVLFILLLYPLLKYHLFDSKLILLMALLLALAIFSFILFIGGLKKWKWIKFAEYTFIFVATAFSVRSLIIGEINFYSIQLLFFIALSGIILLAIWINKLLYKFRRNQN